MDNLKEESIYLLIYLLGEGNGDAGIKSNVAQNMGDVAQRLIFVRHVQIFGATVDMRRLTGQLSSAFKLWRRNINIETSTEK